MSGRCALMYQADTLYQKLARQTGWPTGAKNARLLADGGGGHGSHRQVQLAREAELLVG